MAAQLDYGWSTPKGIAGAKFDLGIDEVATRQNEEADGVMGFGVAVVKGTNAGVGIKLPTSSSVATDFEGITIHAYNTEMDMSGTTVIKKGTSMSVMTKGHIWVKTADGCVPTYGAKAYVVKTTGLFTHVADGNLDVGATFGNAKDTGLAVVNI